MFVKDRQCGLLLMLRCKEVAIRSHVWRLSNARLLLLIYQTSISCISTGFSTLEQQKLQTMLITDLSQTERLFLAKHTDLNSRR